MSHLQKEYLTNLKDAIRQLLAFGKDGNPERMHHFRVSVKRIRGLYRFVNRTLNHHKELKKDRKTVQHIFRWSGIIRDLDLKIAWLKTNHYQYMLDRFGLEEALRMEIAEFRKSVKSFTRLFSDSREEMKKSSGKISKEDILAYLYELAGIIGNRLKTEPRETEWHEIRKLIKRYLSGIDWLEKKDRSVLEQLAYTKELNEFQALVGSWHDQDVLGDWLGQEQPYLSKDPKVRSDFRKAWDKLERSKYKAHQRILRKIKRISMLKIPIP